MMHVNFRPMGGDFVGSMPLPNISQLQAQIFGQKATSSQLSSTSSTTDVMQTQSMAKHIPVQPYNPVNPTIFAFAAAHG